MLVTAFPIVMKFNCALLALNIFNKRTFPASLSLCSLCVEFIYCFPMQVAKWVGGIDLFVYFKIVNIVVSMKTRDRVPPLTKAR